MGGICAFGVRFSDGSLRFGDVYTNAMPIYVEHPKMLDDPSWPGWTRLGVGR